MTNGLYLGARRWSICGTVGAVGNFYDREKDIRTRFSGRGRYALPICFSMSAASSGVALGMTPGSEKLVRNRVAMTKANRNAPTTGIAGVICTAKNGQLKNKKPNKQINKSNSVNRLITQRSFLHQYQSASVDCKWESSNYNLAIFTSSLYFYILLLLLFCYFLCWWERETIGLFITFHYKQCQSFLWAKINTLRQQSIINTFPHRSIRFVITPELMIRWVNNMFFESVKRNSQFKIILSPSSTQILSTICDYFTRVIKSYQKCVNKAIDNRYR